MTTYIAHETNGVYARDKRVYVTSRLRYMPYAQAGWKWHTRYADFGHDGKPLNEAIELNCYAMYSYSSKIFTAEASSASAGIEAITTFGADAAINYSRTTSRQVTAAMQELGLSGSEIAALKRFFIRGGKVACAGDNNWLDAETGAVIWEGVRG